MLLHWLSLSFAAIDEVAQWRQRIEVSKRLNEAVVHGDGVPMWTSG
jgi:hypothetical protein